MSEELDTDNLNMLKDLLGERFDELIETYISDTDLRLSRLKSAFAEGDLAIVSQEAHGIKGSSRNIGANPLGHLCELVEYQARDGKLQDGQQQIAAIEKRLAAVHKCLRSFR